MAALISVPHVKAQETEEKIVRVGWYESTFCITDQFGRKSGMVYEYQQKIAAHTGWKYVYVEDSWPNLFQMLKDGKIDLMSDISFTEERAGQMLFPSLEMGTEWYYAYIDAENNKIISDDLTTFNGKKIGVNKNSIQEGFLKDWIEKNGIKAEIVSLTLSEQDSMALVTGGEIDAYVSLDSLSAEKRMLPVCKIGSSDFYFAVNKDRPDLLKELNFALSRIHEENPGYNKELKDEWLKIARTNAFLDKYLEDWLSDHGTVTIGYLDDYLPFCAYDEKNGEVTGALRDYIAKASTCLRNAEIHFNTRPFTSVQAALDALKKGEIDCVFPINLSTYDGEQMGLFAVAPVLRTEMSIMISKDNKLDIEESKNLKFALNEGNISFETFIKDKYPEWTIMSYPDHESCFSAVAKKEADAVLVSGYRAFYLEGLESRYKLKTVPTGESMRYSFAVNRDSHELYSLLDKIGNLMFNEDMDFILASYMYTPQRTSFMQFLGEHWITLLLVITFVFAAFLFLLSRKLKAERKVIEQQKQIEDVLRRELNNQKQLQSVKKKAYTDPLTGVKSKNSYVEAEQRMDSRIKERTVSEFGIVIFDLNDLKVINDTKGHQAGDQYIKDACRIICTCFKHSPVYRIGGDEFVAILEGADYQNREELISSFEKQIEENSKQGLVTIAEGWEFFDPKNDMNTRAVFERADEKMYERKKQMKQE